MSLEPTASPAAPNRATAWAPTRSATARTAWLASFFHAAPESCVPSARVMGSRAARKPLKSPAVRSHSWSLRSLTMRTRGKSARACSACNSAAQRG